VVKTLDALFEQLYQGGKAMSYHMPTLKQYAEKCSNAVEFGVNAGCSTVAILSAGCHLTSYDIRHHRWHRKIKELAWDRWDFHLQSSLEAEPKETDLLFVDSLHNYDQVKGELSRHGDCARKYIIFHDTVTFGTVGADGETGRQKPGTKGILSAIDEFMSTRPAWKIVFHDTASHGFTVWERNA
jgi:hypothetical protein